MSVLQVLCPASFERERRYSVEAVLGCFLGLEYTLTWCDAPSSHVELSLAGRRLLIRDDFLGGDERAWLRPESLPERPLPMFELRQLLSLPEIPTRVPVLYGAAAVSLREERVELGIDVFAGAFFMLSRYEELVLPARDAHDRFPAEASCAYAHDFLGYPLINVYVELLWTCMLRLWPGLQRKRRSSQTFISCDVDAILDPQLLSLKRSARLFAHNLLRRRSLKAAVWGANASLSVLRHGVAGDPNFCFDYYMGRVERANLRAAFYFITERTHPRFDAHYTMSDPPISELLLTIHRRGHEIGLHPSYETFRSSTAIAREFATLRQTCGELEIEQPRWGGRQHYLRWEPQTWAHWDQAGLSYDSTLTYASCCGFRAGVCYEYPGYDLEARRVLALTVRPLIAMEVSLLSPHYMGLDYARAGDRLRQLRRICRMFDGDFSLLWHNSSFVQPDDRALFEASLV